MNKLENKNTNHSLENFIDLIQAIDKKDKNEVEAIINGNKKYFIENDIVFEIHNEKQLHYRRFQFIIDNCINYLNISSPLIKKLMETNEKYLLEIIFKNVIKFFDNEIIIRLLNYYKNKIPISYTDLNQQLDNDKYKILLKLDDENFDGYNSSFYLFNACEIGNEVMVKYLIEHGADITIKDKKKRTALFSACESGNEHLVRYLVGLGADINEKDIDGVTPIFKTCYNGNEHLVKYLEEKGADANIEDNGGTTPIFFACGSGNVHLVKYLVEERGANIKKQDNLNQTPLMFSFLSIKMNLELIKYIVKLGANVNKQYDDGWTPIFKACEEGHYTIVKYLVEHGADINKDDYYSGTPLFYSCNNGHYNIIKYLVEHGADVNKKTIKVKH